MGTKSGISKLSDKSINILTKKLKNVVDAQIEFVNEFNSIKK